MDKYYSYADFLKAMGRNQTVSEAEKLLNDIYMDLFFPCAPGATKRTLNNFN